MWILQDDTIIKTPVQVTIDGNTYPRLIFTEPDTIAGLGIKEYQEVTPDNRYYWNGAYTLDRSGDTVVGTYASTPRDVDTLKEQMIATVKSQVGSRLKTTDWMVIREADGGTAMNADVKAYRSAVRAEGDAKELEINALATLDDVINYENKPHTEVRKVKHTAEDGTETYGPETESYTREINMTMHFDVIDPLAEVDPAFVSLTEV